MEEILKEVEENLKVSGFKVTKYEDSDSELKTLFPKENVIQHQTRVRWGWSFKLREYIRKQGFLYSKEKGMYISKRRKRQAEVIQNSIILFTNTGKKIGKVKFNGTYYGKINWIYSRSRGMIK